MNIAELSITKKAITLFMIFLIIGGGLFAFEKLGRLEDPEYTIKEAQIVTAYPGGTPKQVEEEVTDKLEIAIQQLPQLKHVKSISKAGLSIINVEIEDKYDAATLPQVWDELRRKINDVTPQLPPGTQKPIVYDDFGDVYGILFAVTGQGYSYRELEDFSDFLRKELLLVPDVAKVEIWGKQPEQVYVEISRQKLAQLGISLKTIYTTLERQNLVSPSGAVKIGSEYIHIRPTGDFKSVQEIGNLLIRGGSPSEVIYLKDIATIKRTYEAPPKTLVRFNDENALAIGISIKSGGNVVQMGEAVKQRLQELAALSPAGMKLQIISFQSDSVTTAISGFIISLVEALAIVIAILMVFMGLRSGLIIGTVLLLTILGTFIGMQIWGINLERISLGALIIALGMLVDNAIVINEGMLIRIEAGKDRINAAKEVVGQSAWPLLAATIIAILAFAAIGLSQNSTGEYTRSLFQVIMISLLLSWIIAVTVTPYLCARFLKPKKSAKELEEDPYKGFLFKSYRKFLAVTVRFRWITLSVLAGLLVLAFVGFNYLENSFFPESTRPQFMVHYWLPEGTDIRQTAKEIDELGAYIKTLDGVDSTAAFIGQGAPRFILTYSPEKAYSSYGIILVNVSNYENITTLMPKVQDYAEKHFINAQIKPRRFVLGPTAEDTIEIRFSGPRAEELRKLANQAKKIMIEDGGIMGIKDNWRERVKVIRPLYAETQARQAGITKAALDDTLQMSFTGLSVGLYREEDKILPILSISPEKERLKIDSIRDIQIWSPVAQKTIPLRQIVSGFETSWEDSVIQRRDRKPTITAQGTQKTGNSSVAYERIKDKIEAIPLPLGYQREWGGEFEKAQEAQEALMVNIPVVIVLMILILVILFNAIWQPLIIILTVPLAIIGVTLGLLVTGQSFGFMALLGFLSLSGMLIKNSIVLIDQINLEISQGKPGYQAILDSSVSRLRPVSMAALTTVLGMTPLLFDIFFIGMAVTIMAGLTFATILTLIVVPVLYCIFFRIAYNKSYN